MASKRLNTFAIVAAAALILVIALVTVHGVREERVISANQRAR
jgi:hypothetical protein